MKKLLTLVLVFVGLCSIAPKKADAGIVLIVQCATVPALGCTSLGIFGLAVATPAMAALNGAFIAALIAGNNGLGLEDGDKLLVPFIIGAVAGLALDEDPASAIGAVQLQFSYLDGAQAQALLLVTQKKASFEFNQHLGEVGIKSLVGIELDDKDLETILGKSFLQTEEGQQVLRDFERDLQPSQK